MLVRLGHSLATLRPTLHNGPGWRVGLWVQGCHHRCTDRCLNPHLLDADGGTAFPAADVADAVRRAAVGAAEPVEGVTVLGGEPFEQAAAVAAVLAPLRRSGLSAMVYSGHTHAALARDPDAGVAALLGETDILVDGPYLPKYDDDQLAWRGSSNQRLVCLTDRYTPAGLAAAAAAQGKGFSLRVGRRAAVASGLQSPSGATAVAAALGLSARFPLPEARP